MTPPRSSRAEPRGTLRKAAIDFWFAVQRMARGRTDPPTSAADYYPPPQLGDDDEGSAGSGVPRRPIPSSGSAGATTTVERDDTELL